MSLLPSGIFPSPLFTEEQTGQAAEDIQSRYLAQWRLSVGASFYDIERSVPTLRVRTLIWPKFSILPLLTYQPSICLIHLETPTMVFPHSVKLWGWYTRKVKKETQSWVNLSKPYLLWRKWMPTPGLRTHSSQGDAIMTKPKKKW